MAILTLLDQIIKAIDNNQYAIGIFIDFAKAFDTVNHKILLQKLFHYGIRGTAHSWVESYYLTESNIAHINQPNLIIQKLHVEYLKGLY
jgi:hypothetical protein